MDEKTEIKAVELVRSIRDRRVELLSGKSKEEIIEFFRQAGEAARREITVMEAIKTVENQAADF
jgi:hypothetical protein